MRMYVIESESFVYIHSVLDHMRTKKTHDDSKNVRAELQRLLKSDILSHCILLQYHDQSIESDSICKIAKDFTKNVHCDFNFDVLQVVIVSFALIHEHDFDAINNDHEIIDEVFQIRFQYAMIVFDAKNDDIVEMQNSIDVILQELDVVFLHSCATYVSQIVLVVSTIFDHENSLHCFVIIFRVSIYNILSI